MKIIITDDGSSSLYNKELNETYHSSHGAIQESLLVFIANGLNYFKKETISILEVGFGTGLNTFLTLLNGNKKTVYYTALETFPLLPDIVKQLNYTDFFNEAKAIPLFQKIHESEWEKACSITNKFTLLKSNIKVQNICYEQQFDLIYYDAFGPIAQPDMWTIAIFEKLFLTLKPNGILVTYCAKGEVKRMLKAVGFKVESLSGPPGKREITRAIKIV